MDELCRQPAVALVARARQGDHVAFAELVRRYRQRILALTLHLTGSESDAEDVTQDVFLRAFRALPSFEGRSQFFTWIYRMAVNRSLNAKRDTNRRRESPWDDPRIDRALEVDAAGNPARAAELRQTYSQLLVALDRLSPAMRTTVVLVTLQGLNHQEAAIVQDCSEGTIAWRMHEARKALRKAMESRPARQARTKQALSSDLTKLLRDWDLPVLCPN